MSIHTTDFQTFVASFQSEDWARIMRALEYYVIDQEQRLSEQNVGDAPYAELDKYSAIRNDIATFVLGGAL